MTRRGSLRFQDCHPVTRSNLIYKLNCGLFALGDVLFASGTKHDFLRLPSVPAVRKEPDWTQIDVWITILDLTMDLGLHLLVPIDHSPPLPRVGFPLCIVYTEEPYKRLPLALNSRSLFGAEPWLLRMFVVSTFCPP